MTERLVNPLVPTITIVTNIWIISKPGELRRHTHGVLGSHLRHWIRAGARPGREDLEKYLGMESLGCSPWSPRRTGGSLFAGRQTHSPPPGHWEEVSWYVDAGGDYQH